MRGRGTGATPNRGRASPGPKRLFVIGIGAGNPEYVTVQAINALNQVDVFFVMDKGPVVPAEGDLSPTSHG